MHASAMAARPAVVYFIGATIEGYRAIQELRKSGMPAWFTCDAGPHVKALTDAAHARRGRASGWRGAGRAETRDLRARARRARVWMTSRSSARRARRSCAGEYAVLHGAPAIAVAVDRYVVAP